MNDLAIKRQSSRVCILRETFEAVIVQPFVDRTVKGDDNRFASSITSVFLKLDGLRN
jgi:hypothetical protein